MNLETWQFYADNWEWRKEQFFDIPRDEHEDLAFELTGCQFALPTWGTERVDCRHMPCMIRRGERQPEDLTRSRLQSERDNWLRGISDEQFNKLLNVFLQVAHESGEYDPWLMPGGWQAIVGLGIGI